MSDKPKWVDLFGMDPEYNKEALDAEREKLFEVYQAGFYQAIARYATDATPATDPIDVAREGFDRWLQEQVDEVDVLGWRERQEEGYAQLAQDPEQREHDEGMRRRSKADAARALIDRLEAEGREIEFVAMSKTADPSAIFGPANIKAMLDAAWDGVWIDPPGCGCTDCLLGTSRPARDIAEYNATPQEWKR